MTYTTALCHDQHESTIALIQQRLSHKIIESPNRSIEVLRAKAWLCQNHLIPDNILDFNAYKLKKSK